MVASIVPGRLGEPLDSFREVAHRRESRCDFMYLRFPRNGGVPVVSEDRVRR